MNSQSALALFRQYQLQQQQTQQEQHFSQLQPPAQNEEVGANNWDNDDDNIELVSEEMLIEEIKSIAAYGILRVEETFESFERTTPCDTFSSC